MAELNQDGTLPDDKRSTFRGNAEHKRFPAGTKFYRVGTREVQTDLKDPAKPPERKGNEIYGEYWMPEDEHRKMQQQAERNGSSVGDVARSRQAVKEKWNPEMSNITEIKLKEPVWGWQGQAASQREESWEKQSPDGTKPKEVHHIGGAQQVYLPNLAERGQLSSKYASVTRYEAAAATPQENELRRAAADKQEGQAQPKARGFEHPQAEAQQKTDEAQSAQPKARGFGHAQPNAEAKQREGLEAGQRGEMKNHLREESGRSQSPEREQIHDSPNHKPPELTK